MTIEIRGLDGLSLEKKPLKDRIRYSRERNEMTQGQLAEKIGAKRAYICDVEAGRSNISVKQAILIAQALGCSPKGWAKAATEELLARQGVRTEVSFSKVELIDDEEPLSAC